MKRNKKGIIAFCVALLIPVLIGYAAFLIDLSQAYTVNTRVKDAVDLATLSGISQLESSSDLTDAKTAALNSLNTNLSTVLPGYTTISLSDSNLMIQGGIYDFSTNTFTYDEASMSINALKMTYSYSLMTLLSGYFNINTITTTGTATAAKQYAGYMPPSTGFPLVIKAADFCGDVSGTMITLTNGMTGNSWWTAFDDMGGTSEVLDILWYWMYGSSGGGSAPGSLTVGGTFKEHLGNDNTVWMNIDPAALENMTYIFPVGTDQGGNMIRADGFIGGTVTDVDAAGESITVTLIEGYINNLYGGGLVQSGANSGALCAGGDDFLAYGYTLVQ